MVVDLCVVNPDQPTKTERTDENETRFEKDRLTRIKERLAEKKSLQPIDASVQDLIQVESVVLKGTDSLKSVNNILDSIPLLKKHASSDGKDRAPLTPTEDEIRMRQIACRLFFWQQFSDRITKAVLKANIAKSSEIAFDPRFKTRRNVEMSDEAKKSLKRIIDSIEDSNK